MEMIALAKAHDCPAVIRADGLEKVAEIAERAVAMGVNDLVIDSARFERRTRDGRPGVGQAFRTGQEVRRARLPDHHLAGALLGRRCDARGDSRSRGCRELRRNRRARRCRSLAAASAARAAPEHLHRPAAADAGRAEDLRDRQPRSGRPVLHHDELLADLLHRLLRDRGRSRRPRTSESSNPRDCRC